MIHNLGWKGPSAGICMASSLVRHGCFQPGVELPLVEEYDLRACCKLAIKSLWIFPFILWLTSKVGSRCRAMTQNPSCWNPTHFPHEPFNCSYAAKQSGESWYFTKDRLPEQFPHPLHLVSLSGSLETTGIENSQAWATQATQFLARKATNRQTTKLQLQRVSQNHLVAPEPYMDPTSLMPLTSGGNRAIETLYEFAEETYPEEARRKQKTRVVSRQPKIVPPKTIWKIYFPVPLVW